MLLSALQLVAVCFGGEKSFLPILLPRSFSVQQAVAAGLGSWDSKPWFGLARSPLFWATESAPLCMPCWCDKSRASSPPPPRPEVEVLQGTTTI